MFSETVPPVGAVHFHQRLGQIESGVCQSRVKSKGPSVRTDGFLGPVQFGEHVGQIVPGAGMLRIKVRRLLVMGESPFQIVGRIERIGQIEGERGVWAAVSDQVLVNACRLQRPVFFAFHCAAESVGFGLRPVKRK